MICLFIFLGMCGIGVCIWNDHVDKRDIDDEIQHIQESIQNRGPDSFSEYKPDDLNMHFIGSVLSMRGIEITSQPLISSCGDILIWNGEVFGGLDVMIMFYV